MNIIFIETFVTAAFSKNITEVANKLHTSQSTISYRLKELENLLEITLIKRSKGIQNIELTHAGKQLLPLAINWLEIGKRIYSFNSEVSPYAISIASVESLNLYFLGKFYQALQSSHKNWQLSIYNMHSHEIVKAVNNQTIDIGLIVSNLTDIGVITEELYSEEIVVVAKNKMLFSNKEIEKANLKEKEEIYVDWGNNYNQWRKRNLLNYSTPQWRSDSFHVAYQLLTGSNWAFAPISIRQYFNDLFYFKLKDSTPYRNIYMVYSADNLSVSQEIISFLKNKLIKYFTS